MGDEPAPSASIPGWLTGLLLFSATAAFCLWQNTRVAVLWDLTYLLDSAWRFSLGQLPYRDLPFAHAPGTFLLHALLIRIFGRVYWPHIACTAIESGLAAVLTWRLILRILPSSRTWRQVKYLLSICLVSLCIYSVYPYSIYDGDAAIAVLIALHLLTRGHRADDATAATSVLYPLASGAFLVVPFFFKQNIGLAFLAATMACVAVLTSLRLLRSQTIRPQLLFFAGLLIAVAASALLIHCTVGLASYRYWTITFAAQRRLPAAGEILAIFRQPSLAWSIPAAILGLLLLRSQRLANRRWPAISAFLLLAAPFLWTLLFFSLHSDADDRADQLLSLWPHLLLLAMFLAAVNLIRTARSSSPNLTPLLPLILLATIFGTFLSQQLWGSTYAIWPLLLLLIAMLLAEVEPVAIPLAAAISTTLLICGGLYAASLERLSYIHLDGPLTHATLPALHGMATPGPWLPQFEAMVRFTNSEIPAGDGILLFPGEDPFYFVTGRTPQFPVLLFDRATDPYTAQQTLDEARSRNIRWLILKRDLQLTGPPAGVTPELIATIQSGFVLYRSLPGYDIYRRP